MDWLLLVRQELVRGKILALRDCGDFNNLAERVAVDVPHLVALACCAQHFKRLVMNPRWLAYLVALDLAAPFTSRLVAVVSEACERACVVCIAQVNALVNHVADLLMHDVSSMLAV